MKSLTEIVKNIKTTGKNLIVYSSMLLALTGAYACGGSDNPDNNAADAQVLQDGGSNILQDTGSNNLDGGAAPSIDCDNLCQLWQSDDCGCKSAGTNLFSDNTYCKNVCEPGSTLLSAEYVSEVKKCFNETFSICSERGEDCLTSARNACLTEGCTFIPNTNYIEGPDNCADELFNRLDPILNVLCERENRCDDVISICSDEYKRNLVYTPYIYSSGYTAVLYNSPCLNNEGIKKIKDCIEGAGCDNASDLYKCGYSTKHFRTGEEGLFSLSCKLYNK